MRPVCLQRPVAHKAPREMLSRGAILPPRLVRFPRVGASPHVPIAMSMAGRTEEKCTGVVHELAPICCVAMGDSRLIELAV